jgi:hypothetical protein
MSPTEEHKTDPNAAPSPISTALFSEEKMVGAPSWAQELGDRMLGIYELVTEVRDEVKVTNSRLDKTAEEQSKTKAEVIHLGERVALIEERLARLEADRIEADRLIAAAD